MDFRWMRPAVRPVSPREVGALSLSAAKVLQALRRKYQHQAPQPLYQPAPSAWSSSYSDPVLGIGQTESVLAFNRRQGAHGQDGHALHARPAVAPLDQGAPDAFWPPARQEPSALFRRGTRSPALDFPHPSRVALSTSSYEGGSFNIAPQTSTAVQDRELSWGEISTISLENDATEFRRSLTSSPVMGKPSRTYSAEILNSPPMSSQSIDMDDVAIDDHTESSKILKYVVWSKCSNTNKFKDTSPIVPSKVLALSNVAYDRGCDETASNDSINLSLELMQFFGRNVSFADNQDGGTTSISLNGDQNPPEFEINCDVTNQDYGNPCHSSDKCTVLDVANPELSFDVMNISSQECPHIVCSPSLPSSKRASDVSDAMFSNFSFDEGNSNNNMFNGLSKKDFQCEDLMQSPGDVVCDITKTQDDGRKKKKKFLGTPFKRALSSTNISSKEQSEENRDDSILAPLQLEVRKNENREPLKSRDDNIKSPCVKDREEHSSPACSKLHESAHLLNYSPSRTREKTPKKATKPLYFPMFAANSQMKRKTVTEEVQPPDVPSLPCKKKLKFSVPYKKNDQTKQEPSAPQKIQELAAKLSKETAKKAGGIQNLTEKLANEIVDHIRLTPPQETCLTLQYRGGFSQLNRPLKSKTHIPETIVLRILWSSAVQLISVPLQTNSWSSSLFKRLFSDKSRKICFDAQDTIKLLVQQFNLPVSEVFSQWVVLDPLIGCWLLNPDEPPRSFEDILKFLKLPEESESLEKLLQKLSECTQILYETLNKNGTWKLFLHVEMRITAILACMELQGVQLNINKLQEMAKLLKDRLEALQKAAHDAAGRPFQLTSPQQLSAILYDSLKLDTKHNIIVKGTDKRQTKSTSESMLQKFKDLHPLPGIILEFRGLHKLKSTYVDAYLGQVSSDCIYTTWDQTAAATGRITSIEPNLQTIPRQPLMPDLPLRTAFVARPGYSFLAADFQHIELRVFAHLSKDNSLINALSQPSDVFEVLSKKWFPVNNMSQVTEEDRDKTKKIVYALMYGAGPSKIAEILQINFTEAAKLLKNFSSTFPKMQVFTKITIEKCRNQGYLATEAGRRRLFPQITNSNFKLRQHCERQAVNFLIQGTAADLCKCAMVHAQRHIAALSAHKATPVAHLLLQIHDELLWEVSDSDLDEVTGVVQEAMEGATSILQCMSTFSVPLPVLMKVGKTWGSMKTVKTNVLLGSASQQA